MNAIIAEIRGAQAAALLEDGRFIRIRNRGYTIGQRVTLIPRALSERQRPQAARKRASLWISMAAALLLIAGVGSMAGHAYYTPYAYVSIDVNPSIELTLNRFLRVLSISAVNDAGAEIVDDLNLRSLQYAAVETAVMTTVSRILESDYAAPNADNYVVITANAGDEKRSEALVQAATQGAQTAQGGDALTVVSFAVSTGEVEEARAQNVTPGKLRMVRMLEEGADDQEEPVDRDFWLQQPVKAIMNEHEKKAQPAASNEPQDLSQASQETPQQPEAAAVAETTTQARQANPAPTSTTEPRVNQETPPPLPQETEPAQSQALPQQPSTQATPETAQPAPSPAPLPPDMPQPEADDPQAPRNPLDEWPAITGLPPPNP